VDDDGSELVVPVSLAVPVSLVDVPGSENVSVSVEDEVPVSDVDELVDVGGGAAVVLPLLLVLDEVGVGVGSGVVELLADEVVVLLAVVELLALLVGGGPPPPPEGGGGGGGWYCGGSGPWVGDGVPVLETMPSRTTTVRVDTDSPARSLTLKVAT
jgi:hypothetical protein